MICIAFNTSTIAMKANCEVGGVCTSPVDQEEKTYRNLRETTEGTASLIDRVAIVTRKGYRNSFSSPAIHSWTVFLVAVEYFQKNPHANFG